MPGMSAELALYIHLPWCIKKCPYCDFNSHTGAVQSAEYAQALLRDLDFELADKKLSLNTERPITSIFFGGGTPSLFPAEDIHSILEGVRKRLVLADDVEVTLEANPGAAEQARFTGYHQAGVNRLSIGVQSFANEPLLALGRVHNAEQALHAYHAARAAGFDNINLDIMYALPKQTLEQAVADCQQALALQPEHVSHYQLTIEPGTHFAHQPPPLPTHDLAWDMQLACQSLLAEHGYQQYEVSAYARAGYRCLHNLTYWQYGDYIGIGAGAHGKWTHRAAGVNILRRARRPHPANYMQSAGTEAVLHEQREVSSSAERVAEFMLNALRLNDGFSEQTFVQQTGCDMDTIQSRLMTLQARDLLTWADGHVQTTAFGRQHLNAVMLAFDD